MVAPVQRRAHDHDVVAAAVDVGSVRNVTHVDGKPPFPDMATANQRRDGVTSAAGADAACGQPRICRYSWGLVDRGPPAT